MDNNLDNNIENNKDNNKSGRIKLLIIVLIVIIALAAALGFVLSRKGGSTYVSDDTLNTTKYGNNGLTRFYKYEDGYIRVCADGAHAYTGDGEARWSIAYSTTNVIADVSGKYAAFADKGGAVIYVTDGSGSQNKITTEQAIEDIEIADQGVVAVWTSQGERDTIYVYDYEGRKLLDINTGIEKEGTPVDLTLSADGKKMVVSYLNVENAMVKNWVTFYNFGEVGQSYTDRVVGHFSYNDSFIPKVEFLTEDRVLVCRDNGFAVYKMKELPELLSDVTAEGTIKSLVSSDKHILMISGDASHKIELYNTDGALEQSTKDNTEYSAVAVFEDSYALFSDHAAHLYNTDGKEKYVKNTKDSIITIYEVKPDRYIFIQNGTVTVNELVEGK